ncbi:MAG: radical SAM protein [Clostridia bacterium]|nr:radical SAM protein [Clostridia bacterium]
MCIAYKVHNNLYINLTNRCSCACVFCLRQTMDKVGESDSLWLEHEPDYDEVVEALNNHNMDDYDVVVFCGFGEPTEQFDLLIRVAKFIKKNYNKPIRINTNGQGNLINGRNIEPEMKGLIDTLSISLNTPDADRYNELVRSKFGKAAYYAMLDFAKEAANYVPNVVLTTVDTTLTKEEEAKCAEICKNLGVTYRIRPWEG